MTGRPHHVIHIEPRILRCAIRDRTPVVALCGHMFVPEHEGEGDGTRCLDCFEKLFEHHRIAA
jgi:hypothetical protein